MARLSKQQIKQDKFVSSIWKGREYFEQHTSQFIIGIAAVVVVVVVAFLVISNFKTKEREAADLLGLGAVEFRGGNYQLAAVDFQKILDGYPGTTAAKFASYQIANAYFELKNYGQAEKYFRLHLDKYKFDDMLTVGAMSGLAHCMRAKGQMQEAGDEFYKAYKKYPGSYIAPDCLYFGIMSYASAGDSAKSRELYDIFHKIPSQTQRSMEVKRVLIEKGILNPAVGAYD